MHHRMEHHAIFIYKLLNNYFCDPVPVSFNGDFQGYYITQDWEIIFANPVPIEDEVIGCQLTLALHYNISNSVVSSLREAESPSVFKCALSKAILWVFIPSNWLFIDKMAFFRFMLKVFVLPR